MGLLKPVAPVNMESAPELFSVLHNRLLRVAGKDYRRHVNAFNPLVLSVIALRLLQQFVLLPCVRFYSPRLQIHSRGIRR